MKQRIAQKLLFAAMLLLTLVPAGLAARPAQAQSGLAIDIQALYGPPYAEVNIYGTGAQPGARVNILSSPFSNAANCATPGATKVEGELVADKDGNFALSLSPQLGPVGSGITYLAQAVASGAKSNAKCFNFKQDRVSRFFPETSIWVRGDFLRYWENNGGLEIFGYPLSTELKEDGRTVQYFERAVFEAHPENQPPWNVLLRLLAVAEGQRLQDQRPFARASAISANNCRYFPETGHNMCGNFRLYWEKFGGLGVYGYPISEEFQMTIAETGKVYTVQYYQRERFELQPGARPERLDVLLGRLGAAVLPAGQGPARETAQIQLPAEGDRVTLPIHLQLRTAQADQMIGVQVTWQDGAVLTSTETTALGEDGAGLLVTNVDFDNEGIPPMPPTQSARLEIRDMVGRVLASRQLTIIGREDSQNQELKVYWVLPFDQEILREVPFRVPRTTSVGSAALERLLWGPGPPNLAGFVSAIPTPEEVVNYGKREADWGPRVTLLKLTVENGVATADFSQEMRAYGGSPSRATFIRAQITRTLQQFPTVQQVRILIEGQADGVLQQ